MQVMASFQNFHLENEQILFWGILQEFWEDQNFKTASESKPHTAKGKAERIVVAIAFVIK